MSALSRSLSPPICPDLWERDRDRGGKETEGKRSGERWERQRKRNQRRGREIRIEVRQRERKRDKVREIGRKVRQREKERSTTMGRRAILRSRSAKFGSFFFFFLFYKPTRIWLGRVNPSRIGPRALNQVGPESVYVLHKDRLVSHSRIGGGHSGDDSAEILNPAIC